MLPLSHGIVCSEQEHWKDQVPFLRHLPGIGLITAMMVLAAVGDISRFAGGEASGRLRWPGYASPCLNAVCIARAVTPGFGARICARSWPRQPGPPSASRPGGVRMVRNSTRRMPPTKAIVAIARKLLVVIWQVLSAQTADQQADPVAVV